MNNLKSKLEAFVPALFSEDGGRLVSLKGEKTYFGEYTPPDLEQYPQEEVEQKLQHLEADLVGADFGEWMKIYSILGNTYFNTHKGPRLGEAAWDLHHNPMHAFLGDATWAQIEFYENYLTVGSEYWRMVSIKTPPSSLSQGSLTSLGDFVLILKKHAPDAARAKLDWKRRLHFSNLFKGIRDLKSENAYQEAEGTLEGLLVKTKALFSCELFFIVKAQDKRELDQKTHELLLELKSQDALIIVESKAQEFFFQTLIPGVAPSLKRSFLATSDYVAGMIPFHCDRLMNWGNIQFLSKGGRELNFGIFDQYAVNYNMLITGSSGQGKSMLVNKIVKESLSMGVKVVCLDLGNSFRKNVLFHGGAIFSEKFNPLEYKSPRYLKEFVLSVLDEKLSKKEEGRLFELISSMADEDLSSMNSFLAKLETGFPGIGHSFAEMRAFITDEKKSSQDLIYCDLGNYPDSIKAPLIIYLIECFKNIKGRKLFIFDECWNLLSKNADYIAECFRTFRKHEASAIAISQNLDDFSEKQLGRVIIQNTYYKFFFKQNLKVSEFVSPHLASEIASVLSRKGEYSEFIAFSETFLKPARFYPTNFEYELFTTDRGEQNKFDSYMEEKGRFISYQEAVKNYVAIKYPESKAQGVRS